MNDCLYSLCCFFQINASTEHINQIHPKTMHAFIQPHKNIHKLERKKRNESIRLNSKPVSQIRPRLKPGKGYGSATNYKIFLALHGRRNKLKIREKERAISAKRKNDPLMPSKPSLNMIRVTKPRASKNSHNFKANFGQESEHFGLQTLHKNCSSESLDEFSLLNHSIWTYEAQVMAF